LPISFTLVVDNFGVKYIGKQAPLHLIETLKKQYTILIDWMGTNYLGLTLDWDYKNRHVRVSVPLYMCKALSRFGYKLPSKPMHALAKFEPPSYGAKVQYTTNKLTGVTLDPKKITFIQQVVGTFLYYARVVDNTMLVMISDLGYEQASTTTSILAVLNYFLDYAATYPNAKIRYYKSNMILQVHSNGSYLLVSKSRSRASSYFFLSDNTHNPHKAKRKRPIHVLCTILRNIMESAAETEIASAFNNTKEVILMRHTLYFLGHPQPPTPIQVDNTTAVSFTNSELKQK